MLIAAAFLDEAWTGVPVIEAPAVERAHALAHSSTAITLFVVPTLIGMVLETRVLLWAERGETRRWMQGAQVVTALGALAAALASAPWMLALALGITGPASGVTCTLAQAALVAANPDARERALARWTLAGALGDLFAPAAVGAIAWLGGSWRAALVLVAAMLLVHALLLARAPMPVRTDVQDDDDDGTTGWRDILDALRNRRLVVWLAASALCSLLDEIFIALAMLHLRIERGVDEGTAATVAAVWAAGAGIGLLATERLLARVSARRLLAIGAVACTIACVAWWQAPSWPLAAAGIFVVGVATAPLYPIAQAQCYAALPGRPVLVGIADLPFMPIEIFAPWMLGALADRAGLPAALVAIAVGPVLLGVVACTGRAWPRSR